MTQPLRILCPTYWYPRFATDVRATYVHDINRHLVMRGHRVRVVTPGDADSAPREEFDGVEVVRFPLALPEDLTYGKVAQSRVGALQKFARLAAMARYLTRQFRSALAEGRDFGADLVHAHWAIPTGPAALLAARSLGVPSVITLHGGDVYVNRGQGYDFPTRWYVKPLLRWTLRGADALTAISEDCRGHAYRVGALPDNMHVVENGADLRRFSPADPEKPPERESGPRTIFACRQLIPRKGIRLLIDAVAQLSTEFPLLRLMIAGDGFERPELEAHARELGLAQRVRFLGSVPNHELPGWYRSALISVIPSLEEGFGIPAAEAMGCGIPVIASDAGGLPEVVEHGVTGLVVPKGNATALANALRALLPDEELRAQMGAAGRARAVRLFSWDRTVERFEQIYAEIGAERGAGDRA
jgi:glycosyltransferase involved in cell wall biosynthesis